MNLFQILILAAIQGAAELLPVSSSAHVIVAEKLMGLDPSAPKMTFLLVMLHTGTMFAVLVYFWKRWIAIFKSGGREFVRNIIIATAVTGFVGLALKVLIEKVILEKYLGHSKGEVEDLFRHLPLIAANLFLIGALIVYAGRKATGLDHSRNLEQKTGPQRASLNDGDSAAIGLVQAICLPLRGFSRSGATISAALIRSVPRVMAEDFSFALAVVLTPPVILLEAKRLFHSVAATSGSILSSQEITSLLQPALLGMVFSFVAGLLALKWLSRWLEAGRWHYFGYYCLGASAVVMALQFSSLTSGW